MKITLFSLIVLERFAITTLLSYISVVSMMRIRAQDFIIVSVMSVFSGVIFYSSSTNIYLRLFGRFGPPDPILTPEWLLWWCISSVLVDAQSSGASILLLVLAYYAVCDACMVYQLSGIFWWHDFKDIFLSTNFLLACLLFIDLVRASSDSLYPMALLLILMRFCGIIVTYILLYPLGYCLSWFSHLSCIVNGVEIKINVEIVREFSNCFFKIYLPVFCSDFFKIP